MAFNKKGFLTTCIVLTLLLVTVGIGPVCAPKPVPPPPPPPAPPPGILGQNLALLKDSNGKILSASALQIESDYKEKVEVNKIRYLSDGLEVVGFVVNPKEKNIKYPVIIFNRGGYGKIGKIIDAEDLQYLSYLSSHNYVIVASQYRGYDGGQGKDEVGGRDINDVLNLIPLAESLPFVNATKIGMLGYSRGGMVTYMAITMTDKVKVAAVVSGATDFLGQLKKLKSWADRGFKEAQELIELYFKHIVEGDFEAECKKRSAIYWPERINVPVLILHGTADKMVEVREPETLAAKLKELGKSHELVIYPGGDHNLTNNSKDRDERILKWFAKHLQ